MLKQLLLTAAMLLAVLPVTRARTGASPDALPIPIAPPSVIMSGEDMAALRLVHARAIEQLASGAALPAATPMALPLLKIVPHGQSVSPYSPYFTTGQQLQNGSGDCGTLADCFGLPLKSEAPLYDVYQVTPHGPVTVFVSPVAPTEELGGLVRRKGGALQYLLPNRKLWSAPVLVGTITN